LTSGRKKKNNGQETGWKKKEPGGPGEGIKKQKKREENGPGREKLKKMGRAQKKTIRGGKSKKVKNQLVESGREEKENKSFIKGKEPGML